jgi:diguanylate cyclase (GGDEF)-like protein/excisionase family DNA binding protein
MTSQIPRTTDRIVPTTPTPRPLDATLTVTKAAKLLGVHPNTIRAWSDAGRLRYYRINPRGDRRYRMGDLQRFLAAAEHDAPAYPPRLASRDGVLRRRPVPLRTLPGQLPSYETDDDVDGLAVLGSLVDLAALATDLEATLLEACRRIRSAVGASLVGIWERTHDGLLARAVDAEDPLTIPALPPAFGVLGRALETGRPARTRGRDAGPLPVTRLGISEVAAPVPGPDGYWGVLLVAGGIAGSGSVPDALAAACGQAVGAAVEASRRARDTTHRLHRAEALRRVASDIGARLDLDGVLDDLVDHALVLFGADRAAVFLRRPDGTMDAEVSRGLSSGYLEAVREFEPRSLGALALAERRPMFATNYALDPRGVGLRAAVIQEGFDTIAAAPLVEGEEAPGLLTVYHDRHHAWTQGELETLQALATHATTAIRTARNYSRMATWTAQLQSIQQLGARLSRLSTVAEIGHAIATELRQLIDYHNVRVYRTDGDMLYPVAMLGQVGEYVDETPDQLRVRVGEGITGWVAEHRIAQNIGNAAADLRAVTIVGTEADLDESMLLAPMLHDEDCLGVLVLSKLGLQQFQDDDLRLLVIYASFAAQAMLNADATQRLQEQSATLERQLKAQRELLRITESILTTLDTNQVLEAITERLGSLIACDNIAIEVVDRATGLLIPLTARGIHADEYLQPWEPGETGIATWVVQHNEPVLITDERHDDRVNHFRALGDVQDGSLIVVPLLGPTGAAGVLTLERLGLGIVFTEDEFELVKLFAAQVSIALKNAEIHRAVEIRARTDDLTGLLNQGTFHDWLDRSVGSSDPFSLVMIDLDRFKDVNERMGHPAGSRLLREIGTAIVAAARDSDHVFRYGGDEFAVLLPRTEAADALHVAERMRAAIHGVGADGSPWQKGGVDVSASIGIATYPRDGTTADAVLLAADRACFVAKRRDSGLIATADEGLALAAEFTLQEPTPVDPPTAALA